MEGLERQHQVFRAAEQTRIGSSTRSLVYSVRHLLLRWMREEESAKGGDDGLRVLFYRNNGEKKKKTTANGNDRRKRGK